MSIERGIVPIFENTSGSSDLSSKMVQICSNIHMESKQHDTAMPRQFNAF